MVQIGKELKDIYSKEGTYENINCNSGNIKILCDDIQRYTKNKPTISTTKGEYCAYIALVKSEKGKYACIDTNENWFVLTETNPGGEGYCNGKTFVCPGGTQTTTPDETANWKTYRDDEYGYEIKYPLSWWVDDEAKNFVGFYKNEPEGSREPVMAIMIEESSLEKLMEDIKNDKYVISTEETIINGEKAYKIKRAQEVGAPVGTIPEFITFLISKKEYTYGISITSSTESAEVIDHLISSFKFTK